jgi:hypothetical protein
LTSPIAIALAMSVLHVYMLLILTDLFISRMS